MRVLYRTTCDNHSGGPASPHTADCFVMVPSCTHGFFDGHWFGSYIDISKGDHRQYRLWCEGADERWKGQT